MMDIYKLFGILSVITYLICSVLTQNEGDIRLSGTNSNSSQGRVEVFYNGSWGTVCDDGFEKEEAKVVCKQLGTSGDSLGADHITDGRFGPGTGPIHIDDISCEGTETKLADCPFGGWGSTDCSHDEDVGVICPTSTVTDQPYVTPPPTQAPVIPYTGNCTIPDDNIRIIGPANSPGVGVVQMRQNNIWGGVCDDSWDILDARVVCRMLCFDPNKALSGGMTFDTSNINESMTVDNVACTGNEASITECSQSAWTVDICQRNEMAKVTCVELNNSPPSRPEPLLECTDGLLKVSFEKSRDPFLEEKHLSVALTYTGPCNATQSTDNHFVTISVPFDECGTIRTSNETHIIYKTVIKYLPTSSTGVISHANTYMVYVQCELPRDVNADKPIIPLTENITQVAPGEFVVNMFFYRNNSFVTAVTQFPLELPLGEWLNVALLLTEVDKNLRLVVPNCYATPTADKNHTVRYPLFTDKCIVDKSVGFFPLNDTWFGFRYETFRFVQFPKVYIHCDAYICEKNDTTPQCDRSCFPTTTAAPGNARRKRSVGPRIVHVTSPTIIVYDTNPSNEIVRPAPKTTTERTNDESSTKTAKYSSAIARITATPTISRQSQTVSSHVTNSPAVGSITETIVEEILIVDSASNSVQSGIPCFIIILISFVFHYIRLD